MRIFIALFLSSLAFASEAAVVRIAAFDTPSSLPADLVLDGVDDQIEIQVAMRSCVSDPSPGCLVQLLPGHHRLSVQGLDIEHYYDNLVIEGYGQGATVIECGPAGSNPGTDFNRGAIAFANHSSQTTTSNVEIRSLTIDCTGHPGGAINNALIEQAGSGDLSGIRIHDVELISDAHGQSGINISGSGAIDGLYVYDNLIRVAGFYGVLVRTDGTCRQVHYWRNDVLLPDPGAGHEVFNAAGIYGGCDGVSAKDNVLVADHERSHSPLACSPCSNFTFSGNDITGSSRTIEGLVGSSLTVGECGIEVEDKEGHGGNQAPDGTVGSELSIAHSGLVYGNRIRNANIGICVWQRVIGASVPDEPVNITIRGNAIFDSAIGIQFTNAFDLVNSGNTVYNVTTPLLETGVVTYGQTVP